MIDGNKSDSKRRMLRRAPRPDRVATAGPQWSASSPRLTAKAEGGANRPRTLADPWHTSHQEFRFPRRCASRLARGGAGVAWPVRAHRAGRVRKVLRTFLEVQRQEPGSLREHPWREQDKLRRLPP